MGSTLDKQLRGVLVATSMALGLPDNNKITTASSGVILTVSEDLRRVALDPNVPGGRQLLDEEILPKMQVLICELDRGPVIVDALSCKVDLPPVEDEQNETLSYLLAATERLIDGYERHPKSYYQWGSEEIANGRIKLRQFDLLAPKLQSKVRAIITGSDRELFNICATKLDDQDQYPGLSSFLRSVTDLPEFLFDPQLSPPVR